VKENLEALKHLHQLVMGVCATILAFSLSSTPPYKKAIDELHVAKKIDWSGYVFFVAGEGYLKDATTKYSFEDVQLNILRAAFDKVAIVPAKSCFMPGETCARVILPVAAELPTSSTTLEGYELFLGSHPSVFFAQAFFDRSLSASMRDQALKLAIPNHVPQLWSVTVVPRLQMRPLLRGVLWYFDGPPPLGAVPGEVVFTVDTGAPAVNGQREMPGARADTSHIYANEVRDVTPALWLKTSHNDAISKDAAAFWEAHFVAAHRFWDLIATKTIDSAISYLQEREEASGRGPSRGENENGAFFRLENHQPVALAGDYRRNTPWTTVSRS
jgi:hypothetical protein